MARTYIKLKITHSAASSDEGDRNGGFYLDAVTGLEEWPWRKDATLLHYAGQSGHSLITINKPLAEVEEMLAAAHAKKPKELDWRDISGIPVKPPKPKKSLAKRFGLRR